MKTVNVKASENYDILIQRGLIKETGTLLSRVVKPCKAAIITDDIVDSLYSETVTTSLKEAGYEVCKFVFPNGEGSKSVDTWLDILAFLSENSVTKSDVIVALGGGVVGDIAGFAASAYLRGVPFIQIPTTFLSAIDSSVGGKTAVNLASGKNLAGAFYQPKLVICDPDTLSTLLPEVFADGTAEAIKYGVLSSIDLFETLSGGDFMDNIEEIILQCVSIKAALVEQDEFDSGARQLLNLGHTVGHAIEKCSGYAVTHGHAVAIGMAVVSRAADMLGYSLEGCYIPISQALKNNSLPTTCSWSAQELGRVMMSDKKRRGDKINLIIPKQIGKCVLQEFSTSDIEGIISVGLGE